MKKKFLNIIIILVYAFTSPSSHAASKNKETYDSTNREIKIIYFENF